MRTSYTRTCIHGGRETQRESNHLVRSAILVILLVPTRGEGEAVRHLQPAVNVQTEKLARDQLGQALPAVLHNLHHSLGVCVGGWVGVGACVDKYMVCSGLCVHCVSVHALFCLRVCGSRTHMPKIGVRNPLISGYREPTPLQRLKC